MEPLASTKVTMGRWWRAFNDSAWSTTTFPYPDPTQHALPPSVPLRIMDADEPPEPAVSARLCHRFRR